RLSSSAASSKLSLRATASNGRIAFNGGSLRMTSPTCAKKTQLGLTNGHLFLGLLFLTPGEWKGREK
ncbi:hypothetical protein, partial [Tritonibacter sp. SIMBA_163]|uniref:hypothetical protein n=1 Tax=Tritonibacter sp. SIMBA_163 TaxID=3080868 RepID=UPI00397E9F20